jgi:hypothetical protein
MGETITGQDRDAGSALAQFQLAMLGLVERGRAIDIRSYEIAPLDRIAAELQPETLLVVRQAKALLASILDSCQHMAPSEWIANDDPSPVWSAPYLPFERAIDATMVKLGSHQAVDEIAFIAQLELRQREERLERLRPSQGLVALLGECDSSLRRVRKAMNAVDAAIAKVEQVAPLLDFASELETSLAVRRAYAKFRAGVLGVGEPSVSALRARLRGAGTQIAMLVGWRAYPDMRVQDRLLLRDLQQRILEWLRGGAEVTPAGGIRLWQDLAACVEMFALVNRRQELVEHDQAIVRELTEALACDLMHADAREKLGALEGLDPELDAAVQVTSLSPADLRPILARLAAQLGGPAAVAASDGGELPW